MNLTLRPYQEKIVSDIRNVYRERFHAPLLVSPTGSGKTVIFAYITEGAARKGNRILILTHRKRLIRQTSRALDGLAVPHGIIAPGYPLTVDHVQVASVQTVVRRLDRISAPDMIIADEAHHVIDITAWGKTISRFPSARLLGVTATPVRLDGKGLGIKAGGFYDKLVYGPTVRELTALGFLSPSVVYAPPVGADLEGLRHKYGDYQMAEAAERLDKPTITGCAVAHYQRICPGVPAIAFCSSVEHAEHVAEQFNDAGIPAASIDGTMTETQREYRLEGLGNGRFLVITSCDLISEGLDVPVVTAAILLRPTESMGLCLQQIGRCLRPFPGKTQSIILDHVGNCLKYGLPDDDREWSLDGEKRKPRGERDINPYVQCMQCYAVYSRTLERCPQCGAGREIDRREIEQVEGELELITPESIRLDYLKREEAKRNKVHLMQKAETLDDFKALAKIFGYHWKWAVHVYNARQERKTA